MGNAEDGKRRGCWVNNYILAMFHGLDDGHYVMLCLDRHGFGPGLPTHLSAEVQSQEEAINQVYFFLLRAVVHFKSCSEM